LIVSRCNLFTAVARPGFVPSHVLVLHQRKAVDRNSGRVSVQKILPHFLQRNSTTARPSQFSQLSGYWSFCFRNEGNATRSFGTVGNPRATCPDCTSVSVPMPPPFAMSGEEILKSCSFAKKLLGGAAGGFLLYTKSLMWLASPSKKPPYLSRAPFDQLVAKKKAPRPEKNPPGLKKKPLGLSRAQFD